MSRSTKLFQRLRNSFHQWFTLMLFTDNHLTQKALVCFMEMLYMKKTIFESFTGLICSDLLLSKFDRLVKHILFSLSKIYMAMHIIQSLSLLWASASRLVYTAKSKLQESMFSDGKEIFRRYLTLGRHLKRQITKSIVKGERLNEVGGGGLQPVPPFNFQRRLLHVLIYLDILKQDQIYFQAFEGV